MLCMRRQITASELHDLYHAIGGALWYLQYLEDVLVKFLATKALHARRAGGAAVRMRDADEVIARMQRTMTLGKLIQDGGAEGVIRNECLERFRAFKVERDWLVHRSMVENGDDLYLDATREAVFGRIEAIRNEAASLKQIIVEDLESWMAAHGIDVAAAQRQGEQEIRRLKGLT